MWLDPCGTLNQQAVCNNARGLPTEPFTQVGTDAPENNVTGHAVGLHQYWKSSTNKMYIFGGTVGTKVGWVILN